MRNIDELLKQAPPKRELTPEEYTEAAYLATLARHKDFRPDADRQRWPKPIGPRWKN